MRNLPRVGEIMYADSSGSKPVKIVHADGYLVWYVPAGTEVRVTNKGNLYDSNGGSPYWE